MNKLFKVTIKTCPFCGGTERYRTARSRKWKLLVFMRSYSCRDCHSQYLCLFDRISLLVERGFTPFYIPESKTETEIYSG